MLGWTSERDTRMLASPRRQDRACVNAVVGSRSSSEVTSPRSATEFARIFFVLHFRANQDYFGPIVVPTIIENRRSERVRTVFGEVM